MSDPTPPPLPIPTGLQSPLNSYLTTLLDCVCQTLEANNRAACCCCIYPGAEVPWDYCEHDGACEGMAYVNVRRIHPTKMFPYEDLEADPCMAHQLAVDIRVGVLRCAPTVSDTGALPPCDALTDAALGVLDDRMLLSAAIRCCFMEQVGCDAMDVRIGGWRPLGPQGGCVGGEIGLWLAIGECRC